MDNLNNLMNIMAEEEIIRKHEKKARREIIKQRAQEMINEGVEPKMAKYMATIFYDYNV